MTIEVLIVTVAYRSDRVIGPFLRSVAGATKRRTRVVVVNNGPDPLPILEPPTPHVEVVALETGGANLGYGGGINRGAREGGDAPWLLAANPDLVFDAGAIDELISVALETPSAGMIGPLIRTPTGEIYRSARRLPSLRTGIGHALLARPWPDNPWTRRYRDDGSLTPERRRAGWLSGSCILFPRPVFDRVGGFDESYFMYFEDVDLGARVARAGFDVLYAPSAEIVHIGGDSTRGVSRLMIQAHHRSAYRYLSRRYSAWYLAPLRVALRVGLALRARIVRQ